MSSSPHIDAFKTEADKVIQHLHSEFAKLQTGRAQAVLVEDVEVEAYGSRQPLKTLAGISVPEARQILIQPWDRSIMGAVEKALTIADLGANPVNDGVGIRLNFPPMTEERRAQLVKVVGKLAEEARIAIRQRRQDAHDAIKLEKEEDVKETQIDWLQKAVDEANAKVAEAAEKKEKEVMTV